MRTFVLITTEASNCKALEQCLKNNPFDKDSFDPASNTVTYKIYCISLEEAFEIGYEFGQKYKIQGTAQQAKKVRSIK